MMDDSDRNILASLAHEGCDAHCCECGKCIEHYDYPADYDGDGDDIECDECIEWFADQPIDDPADIAFVPSSMRVIRRP